MKPPIHHPSNLPAFLGLDGPAAGYADSRAVVIPVPYEATCSYKGGTARGPGAILEASPNAEWFDEELQLELDRVGIATLPALNVERLTPKEMVDTVESSAERAFADGKIVAGLGGEHTVSLGFIKAALRHHPGLTVLQVDAHPDLRETYEGRPICHATVGRRICELAPLVQVGLRAWSIEEERLIEATCNRPVNHDAVKSRSVQPLTVFPAARIHRDPDWISQVVSRLGDTIYVTFDVDGLDVSLMPATGTPEPGGLTWRQAADLLHAAAGAARIVGFDVVELSPIPHLHHCDYTAARLAARLIGLAVQSQDIRD